MGWFCVVVWGLDKIYLVICWNLSCILRRMDVCLGGWYFFEFLNIFFVFVWRVCWKEVNRRNISWVVLWDILLNCFVLKNFKLKLKDFFWVMYYFLLCIKWNSDFVKWFCCWFVMVIIVCVIILERECSWLSGIEIYWRFVNVVNVFDGKVCWFCVVLCCKMFCVVFFIDGMWCGLIERIRLVILFMILREIRIFGCGDVIWWIYCIFGR